MGSLHTFPVRSESRQGRKNLWLTPENRERIWPSLAGTIRENDKLALALGDEFVARDRESGTA